MTRTDSPQLLQDYAIRACYSDTDSAGVIHHARILEFFERSRTEWLHRLGAAPRHLMPLKRLLIIREVTLSFYKPGRLDDLLVFFHHISHLGNSQFTLEQSAYKIESLSEVHSDLPETSRLASAVFHLVCVNTDTLKSTSLPSIISEIAVKSTL